MTEEIELHTEPVPLAEPERRTPIELARMRDDEHCEHNPYGACCLSCQELAIVTWGWHKFQLGILGGCQEAVDKINVLIEDKL